MAVRRHPITGDPILFAPGRAGRPNAFGRDGDAGDCPFCPGNEAMTPREIERSGEPWRVRVFPNKYPAVEGHEVIVESSDHDPKPATTPEVVETWIRRLRAHPESAYVALFKNAGERAGASIDHAHSQLMPLAFVPPRIEREAIGFARGACPLCSGPEELVIARDDHFSWVAPHGSMHAYEQWILPRRHLAAMPALNHAEIASLAAILDRAAIATLRFAPAYNFLFMNFPAESGAHFYVDVVPRTTALAGFELGTGTFIDIVDPAAAVLALR
ncbi:MAG: DUF4921 family protein [Thermoanaerobaculia bacterium]|nr:DUF4921 family protein [Thermoanaerobaculia bacterium]